MTHTFAANQQLHFDRDMTALSVRSPQYEPHGHRYIGQVIRLASGLLEVGGAYGSGGSVYFRGRAVAGRAGLDQAEAVRLAAEYGGRPMTRPKTIRSTWPCGRRANRATRPGILPGARAGRAGTPNVPRWPYPCSASACLSSSGRGSLARRCRRLSRQRGERPIRLGRFACPQQVEVR